MPKSIQLKGIPVSPSIAIGPVFLYRSELDQISAKPLAYVDVEREVALFKAAVEKAKQQLREIKKMISEEKVKGEHVAIFDTHILLLEDPLVIDETIRLIRQERKSADYVFYKVIENFANRLKESNNEYFKARGADLYDVANRVIRNLRQSYSHILDELKEEVIVVANELGPSDTAHMINGKVIAFATDRGGPTSHTAIMAKALEIPAVVGLDKVSQLCATGDTIIVDGVQGLVIINPTEVEVQEFTEKLKTFQEKEQQLRQLAELPAETLDGHRLELHANIELPEEVRHVNTHGAEGIGLYRTEFIFLDRETLPTEEEQFEVYKAAVHAIHPKPVVFRTIDLGGDKFASLIPVPRELNPFLGLRAIRLCLEFPQIFRTQLRALLRASALGDVKIMLPMIADISELKQALAIIQQVKGELLKEHKEFNPQCEIGIMIEVPSAVMIADVLAQYADFFSIGTNDLIQYTFAVDRINEKVAHLYQPLHPAILRMIKNVIGSAHRRGIWISVCGEMAAEPILAVLLMGMGIDKLSMAAVNIPPVKRLIRSVNYTDAQRLAEVVLQQDDIGKIQNIVYSQFCSLDK